MRDDVGLGEHEEAPVADPEALGAQAHLRRRLLGARVQNVAATRRRHAAPGLEEQRRLADPGLAPEQDDRARNEAAAENAVEARKARRAARALERVDVADRDRRVRRPGPRAAGAGFSRASST